MAPQAKVPLESSPLLINLHHNSGDEDGNNNNSSAGTLYNTTPSYHHHTKREWRKLTSLSKALFITLILPCILITTFLSTSVLGRSVNTIASSSRSDATNARSLPRDEPKVTNDLGFDWEKLTPSNVIKWVPCFKDFLCARLIVPLDYNDPTNPLNATLAILNYPSKYEGSNTWAGPVLMNPGGPGGSGVGWVLNSGPALQAVIGERYSIIGWDPRGVNNTIPRVDCFPEKNGVEKRKSFYSMLAARGIGTSGVGVPDVEDVDLGDDWVTTGILGSRCYRSITKQKAVGHLGTAATATDIVSISEGIWDEAEQKVKSTHGAAGGKLKRKGVQFWGISYGSVLGITFSQMFPDRIERVIVDGIVDVPDYYHAHWAKNLFDMEPALDAFFTHCQDAGADLCPFYTTTGTGRARLSRIFEALRKRPLRLQQAIISGNDDDDEGFGTDVVLRFADLRAIVFQALYGPIQTFPPLASLLAQIELEIIASTETGEQGTLILPALPQNPLEFTCPLAPPKRDPDDGLAGREVTGTILCSDGAPNRPKDTYRTFQEYLKELRTQSPTIGDVWAMIRLACTAFPAGNSNSTSPPGIPTPPLLLGKASSPEDKIAPKNPVLIIGNTADPVTPLRNAYAMRDGMFRPGRAGVVVQKGAGHCSVNVPSACMARIIRGYFDEGRVPAGQVCEQEVIPFLAQGTGEPRRERLAVRDGKEEVLVVEEEEEEEGVRLRRKVMEVGRAWGGLKVLRGVVLGEGLEAV